MRSHITKGLKVFIFFAIGIVILYLLYQRQDAAFRADCAIKGISAENCSLMSKIKDDISNANYYWVSITMMPFMLTNILRALRWKMMFVAIGYRPRMINLVGTIMINYLANLGIPRSGEVIRAGLLSGYEDIPIEKVLGTIFTDRIFDVMMLLIVIVLAMFFGGNDFLTYLNQNINIGSKLAGIFDNSVLIFVMIALMILSTVVLWKSRSRIMSTTPGQKLVSLFTGFADGGKVLPTFRQYPFSCFTQLQFGLYTT
ncbi:MAG: flippase-like domain-containing protein [Saprospiraceae bacterium]|nr:flippase-like domain-containing protein [Saprospiraceae bacterium]